MRMPGTGASVAVGNLVGASDAGICRTVAHYIMKVEIENAEWCRYM
jgi:hypothetical protein